MSLAVSAVPARNLFEYIEIDRVRTIVDTGEPKERVYCLLNELAELSGTVTFCYDCAVTFYSVNV